MVGRTPRSARDALVPQPVQRYQHLAGCQQADGGVGRGPGGPPHQQHRRRYREKYVALANLGWGPLWGRLLAGDPPGARNGRTPCGVDDDAGFPILFPEWVTSTERYGVTSR